MTAEEAHDDVGAGRQPSNATYLGSVQIPDAADTRRPDETAPPDVVEVLLQEIRVLRAQVRELRVFETLAVGCAEAIVQRSERLRNVL